MTTSAAIVARDHVNLMISNDDSGEAFARVVLGLGRALRDLRIDLTGLPPAFLISPFFNGFLQAVWDEDVALLEDAKQIQWQPEFEFQAEAIRRWTETFKPAPAEA